MGFFFAGFFQALGYYRLVGAAQLIAELLLLFGPTSTLGVAFYLPIILNIFVITVSVGFSGTWVISGLMLLANVYLICWDYNRWKAVLPGFTRASPELASRHVSSSVFVLLFLSAVIGISSLFLASVSRLRHSGLPSGVIALVVGAILGTAALCRHLRQTHKSRTSGPLF